MKLNPPVGALVAHSLLGCYCGRQRMRVHARVRPEGMHWQLKRMSNQPA